MSLVPCPEDLISLTSFTPSFSFFFCISIFIYVILKLYDITRSNNISSSNIYATTTTMALNHIPELLHNRFSNEISAPASLVTIPKLRHWQVLNIFRYIYVYVNINIYITFHFSKFCFLRTCSLYQFIFVRSWNFCYIKLQKIIPIKPYCELLQ